MIDRVIATDAAIALIEKLRVTHGDLLFHQSGGCCDGSAPMCYPRDEFQIGDVDFYLGDIGGQPVYIGKNQYALWSHTQLIIDVVEGRGAGFSLEAPEGLRFLSRSRVFTEDEISSLSSKTGKPQQ